MSEYLIIGTGPAGISAAEAIRKLDSGGRITLVTEEKEGYYSRPGLAYLLTGEIPQEQLYPFSRDDFQRLQLKLEFARAVQILPAQHQVVLHDGGRIGYDRVLIAAGAQAIPAMLPGAQYSGVIKMDTLAEARQIIKMARAGRQAVVAGGGITALEIVEGLRTRGTRVHYLLRGERYWQNVLDATESRIVENRLRHEGVQIHDYTELVEILGKRGKLVGAVTNQGRVIPCDLVAMAIGVRPRLELAHSAGLAVDKGILVDETMRTSSPDIYAAGDVAQVFDPELGKAILDSLWEPARAQGRVAGMNMAGLTQHYAKGTPLNVTRLAGITTTIIGRVGGREGDPDIHGIVRGDSEGWRYPSNGLVLHTADEVNRLRLIVGEQHLLGGIVMGDQSLSRIVHHLVSQQVDIRPIRDRILQPGAPVGTLLGQVANLEANDRRGYAAR